MKQIGLVVILAVLSIVTANAQKVSTTDTVDIQMPRFCCESLTPIVEKCLVFERGVKSVTVNSEDKYVTIIFNHKKTNQEKLEKALADIGVETPNCKANVKAIEKLPACCRAAAKGERDGCDHSKM
ncbi:MAG: hypothetical protein LBR28_01250 [Bacteroidales bacterium]|jgi:hypothetical protein|nr:hypothetical protein [Bacteroidales bacterium]